MGNFISQSYPPNPTLTEVNLPDQTGKVFIVTGGASGVGFALVKILYQKNGTVYIAGRSQEKGLEAVSAVQQEFSASKGRVEFLLLDLGDLTGIKSSAEEFMSKEQRLDVLWNNAGVMVPPQGSVTAQGYELQIGTNCLAPYLFSKSLLPVLKRTAETSPTGSVRVAWAGSFVVDLATCKGGMDLTDLWYKKDKRPDFKYAQSKCGNAFLASEFGKKYGGDGIISIAFNPGNLKTPLQRHVPSWQMALFNWALYDPKFGAYTELWSGLSSEVTPAHNGAYVIPWGRFHDFSKVRPDIADGLKLQSEGGLGRAEQFYAWCEEQTAKYA